MPKKLWLLFSQAVTVSLALLFVVMTLKPEWLPRATPGGVAGTLPMPTVVQALPPPGRVASAPAAGASTLVLAARTAAPAVVSVVANKPMLRNPHADDPRFREFQFPPFPQRDPRRGPRQPTGLGSGVIVAPEGYLLTNHHVIEGAEEIEVQLADGRSAKASVVGSDPETDIAVLRIELPDLPVIAFGDARSLQVGDPVLAIGNPFGVGQTVTSGIISALGRRVAGDSPFQSFVQTDAAINPGNSGGALVDAAGRLVGINTAIFTRTGGSLGIGFAVPADTAQAVLTAVVRDGGLRRGWIGIEPRDLDAELAQSLNLPVKQGVLVAGVLQDGPASRAGLRPGDVIVGIGGRPVPDRVALFETVAALEPKATVRIDTVRGSDRLALDLVVGQRPPPEGASR
jgi:Do/DeqQ family serine protease